MAKTTVAKTGQVDRKWLLVDATDKIVGRLASEIATILMGKHRPIYTPHVDTGDYIVVVNVEKIRFTGKKWEQKKYAWYTGYTRQRTVTAEVRRERKPELILQEAVRRMLPKSKLGRAMLSKLKVFAGPEHPHTAQKPEPTELALKS
ncbi:MAG: 50S ribosomal protein L13 [Planctomycetes bacterium]|nr:50S ribosomal protein L13 [Planctomycetota bacterium]